MMHMTKKFDIFEAIYMLNKGVYFLAEKIVKLFCNKFGKMMSFIVRLFCH